MDEIRDTRDARLEAPEKSPRKALTPDLKHQRKDQRDQIGRDLHQKETYK